MNKQEREGKGSRVRQSGHRVSGSLHGEQIIEALRDIAQRGSYATINGTQVDSFSASAVIAIYDKTTPANQEKLLAMPVLRMVAVAFATLKRLRELSGS